MQINRKSKAESILRQTKLRRTDSRVAILKVLLKAQKPLTQQQITSKLKKEALNKTTIYRTLESFIEAGLVHRAFLQNKSWHFELADRCSQEQCHPHFTCGSCGKTDCLTDVSTPMASGLTEGYIIYRQQVQLQGLCPACGRRKNI